MSHWILCDFCHDMSIHVFCRPNADTQNPPRPTRPTTEYYMLKYSPSISPSLRNIKYWSSSFNQALTHLLHPLLIFQPWKSSSLAPQAWSEVKSSTNVSPTPRYPPWLYFCEENYLMNLRLIRNSRVFWLKTFQNGPMMCWKSMQMLRLWSGMFAIGCCDSFY